MFGSDVAVPASDGASFECYLVLPWRGQTTSTVVLASAVNGVNADLREIANVCAARGYVAVAPGLFWRNVPGPFPDGDPQSHS
jgi:carboxymethylenebutenolidase